MIKNDLFLRTLNGESIERPPVWFMRQAGRYLPNYMKLKQQYSFFERVRNPELAAAITVMPIDEVGVDAAILFSDILVIAQSLGLEVLMEEGKGPQLPTPVRSKEAVEQLTPQATEEVLAYAIPAIQAVKQALNDRVPLIGFCGSPWTLLCYMVEGKGSKEFSIAKQFCAQHPEWAHSMLEAITEASIIYLKMQVRAGVNALQIFDSWGGMLGPDWYQKFSLPYIQKMVQALKEEVPVIVFGKGCWFALKELSETGAAALGLDWTIKPTFARAQCGDQVVFQGNLDPSILLSSPEQVAKETLNMIQSFGVGKHIVNLGHGVLPQTSVDSAKAFVETAKSYTYGIKSNL